MKDWKTILLEQIIRENLSEQIKVTVVTKSIAIGSDATLTQFNASDKAWIAALPEKGKNEKYNRVYVKIKSNVTGTTTPGSVPATERIKKIKDFLDDNTVKTALTKVDKDWIWIISNPETSRFKSAGSPDDPDNPGAQVFMIAGMRKADINNFDTGLNNITPAHGKLANGNLVYSEAQIADLKTLSSKSKPTSDPDTTIILDKSAIAGKLTDIRELQKYLYAYFNKNKSILPEFMKSFLNEFIQENYNVTTGEWKGVLNHKTRELADHFATATADEHTFNYPGVNQLVSIDETFYKNLADSYAPLQLESKVIQYNTLLTEADFTKLKPIETKEDENGNLVKVTVTEPEEKKKVTPVVQGGDGKKKPEEQKPEEQKPEEKKNIDKYTRYTLEEVNTYIGYENTPVKGNIGTYYPVKLVDQYKQETSADGNKTWVTTGKKVEPKPTIYVYNASEADYYVMRCATWSGPFAYPGDRKDKKLIPHAVRFVDPSNMNKRFTAYGIFYKDDLDNTKWLFRTELYTNKWTDTKIPSGPDKIIFFPQYYSEHVTKQLRNPDKPGTSNIIMFSNIFLKSNVTQRIANSDLKTSGVGVTLGKTTKYKYENFDIDIKIVGRLYGATKGRGTYEDQLIKAVKMIKDYKTLKAVCTYMDYIGNHIEANNPWFIPTRMSWDTFSKKWNEELEMYRSAPKYLPPDATDGTTSYLGTKYPYTEWRYGVDWSNAYGPGDNYKDRELGIQFKVNAFSEMIMQETSGDTLEQIANWFYENRSKLNIRIKKTSDGQKKYLYNSEIGLFIPWAKFNDR